MTDASAPASCDLFIRNATGLDGQPISIAIEAGTITAVGDASAIKPASIKREIDATGKLVAPARANAHTHASMTLFRGFADDLALMDWLQNHIWPAEAKLTEDDCYWGAKLAAHEMIRTGTTFFSDMYWHLPGVARAVKDSSIRAAVAAPVVMFVDMPYDQMARDQLKRVRAGEFGGRLIFQIGPHAPHTTTREQLEWVRDFSTEHNLGVHIHLAETLDEMKQIKDRYDTTPGRLLNDIGLVNDRLQCAHCVWLDDDELDMFSAAGVTLCHCAISNMKLASGGGQARPFRYQAAHQRGCKIAIGTDGTCSNNSLDMFQETKVAALLAKHSTGEPTAMPATAALEAASRAGFTHKPFNLDGGRIGVGAIADLILLPLDDMLLTPHHNFASHLAYAVNGLVVDTTICDGQVLMENRQLNANLVGDPTEARHKANEAAARVCAK